MTPAPVLLFIVLLFIIIPALIVSLVVYWWNKVEISEAGIVVSRYLDSNRIPWGRKIEFRLKKMYMRETDVDQEPNFLLTHGSLRVQAGGKNETVLLPRGVKYLPGLLEEAERLFPGRITVKQAVLERLKDGKNFFGDKTDILLDETQKQK